MDRVVLPPVLSATVVKSYIFRRLNTLRQFLSPFETDKTRSRDVDKRPSLAGRPATPRTSMRRLLCYGRVAVVVDGQCSGLYGPPPPPSLSLSHSRDAHRPSGRGWRHAPRYSNSKTSHSLTRLRHSENAPWTTTRVRVTAAKGGRRAAHNDNCIEVASQVGLLFRGLQ